MSPSSHTRGHQGWAGVLQTPLSAQRPAGSWDGIAPHASRASRRVDGTPAPRLSCLGDVDDPVHPVPHSFLPDVEVLRF